uniref:uncharacterized protein LOC120333462 n=1 Tax=Styela clava TaxID=7725 RepID=UPI001939587E|nr:uncharacterized protein LOC120333462 [Styela clava]
MKSFCILIFVIFCVDSCLALDYWAWIGISLGSSVAVMLIWLAICMFGYCCFKKHQSNIPQQTYTFQNQPSVSTVPMPAYSTNPPPYPTALAPPGYKFENQQPQIAPYYSHN